MLRSPCSPEQPDRVRGGAQRSRRNRLQAPWFDHSSVRVPQRITVTARPPPWMTYFRPRACWKSWATNLEIGVIHRSVDGTNPGAEPDFSPARMRLAITEVQPIERPRVRRREPPFDEIEHPQIGSQYPKLQVLRPLDSIKTGLHHPPAAML